jgi:hypothetical protein
VRSWSRPHIRLKGYAMVEITPFMIALQESRQKFCEDLRSSDPEGCSDRSREAASLIADVNTNHDSFEVLEAGSVLEGDVKTILADLEERQIKPRSPATVQRIVTRVGDRTRMAVIALREEHPNLVPSFRSNGWSHISSTIDVVKTRPGGSVAVVNKNPGPFIFHVFER